ncbi:signal peptide-containing protein [Theileria equi strain WA]|uniref:Signal peptide-containing protein n=1 Tax=Theileria equi strain WA TaxID=1537102 RepID=L0AVV6_THEEQ|nr:signal peptide-containing protein [Theileria equi strain WA]AFZ79368.1 signal peptide-containing protein [Theileria equi strain WA]|eukprot:XP_004829034.1 signal peptide-containing protein [Theileria equi strain WA]
MKFIATFIFLYTFWPSGCLGALRSAPSNDLALCLNVGNPDTRRTSVLVDTTDGVSRTKVTPDGNHYFGEVTEGPKYVWVGGPEEMGTDVNLYHKTGHSELLSVLVKGDGGDVLLCYEKVGGKWTLVDGTDFGNKLALLKLLPKGLVLREEEDVASPSDPQTVDVSNKFNGKTFVMECSDAGVDSATYTTKGNAYITQLTDGGKSLWNGGPGERCHSFQFTSKNSTKLLSVCVLFGGKASYKYFLKGDDATLPLLSEEFRDKLVTAFGVDRESFPSTGPSVTVDANVVGENGNVSEPEKERDEQVENDEGQKEDEEEKVGGPEEANLAPVQESGLDSPKVEASDNLKEPSTELAHPKHRVAVIGSPTVFEEIGDPFSDCDSSEDLEESTCVLGYEPSLGTLKGKESELWKDILETEEKLNVPEGNAEPYEDRLEEEGPSASEILEMLENKLLELEEESEMKDNNAGDEEEPLSFNPAGQEEAKHVETNNSEKPDTNRDNSPGKEPNPNAAAAKPTATASFTKSSIFTLLLVCSATTLL